LVDQLLLPAALASEASQYRVAEISTHLTTNAAIIEQFGLARVTVDEAEKLVSASLKLLKISRREVSNYSNLYFDCYDYFSCILLKIVANLIVIIFF